MPENKAPAKPLLNHFLHPEEVEVKPTTQSRILMLDSREVEQYEKNHIAGGMITYKSYLCSNQRTP
jgi:hypothetical protein